MSSFSRHIETAGALLLALVWISPLFFAFWTAFHTSSGAVNFNVAAPWTLDNFRTTWAGAGLIDWVIDLGDTRVVGLDTLVEGQGGGRLRAESLDLLSRATEGAGDRAVVVALHHPPLRTGIRFMDAIGLENLADLAATMPNYTGSIHFVAGHVHGVFQGRIGQHPVATVPSLCSAFALDRRKDARAGFMTGRKGQAALRPCF